MWYLYALVLNVLNAIHDGNRIKRNEKIYHWANGLITLVFVGVSYLITKDWKQVIGLLAFRKITFDIALNIKRGKHPLYISTTTTSVIDKFSFQLFRNNPYMMYGFYLLIIVASLL